MASHSFYIPHEEEESLMFKLQRIARQQKTSISDLITSIIKNYVENKAISRKKSLGWTKRFCGSWKGAKDPDKLINLIEKSRSSHKIEPLH